MATLTQFSDDILLYIFSFLNSWDLVNISETCQRFHKIGKDHLLWRTADFEGGQLSASQILRKVLPYLQKCTADLHLRGQKRDGKTKKVDFLTPSLLKNIAKNCPDLEAFHISEAVVDARKVKLLSFGELKELVLLSIRDCEFNNHPSPVTDGSYFRKMQTYFPKLESLEISQCNWITDYDLMVLSKLDTLKTLNLVCDLRIGFTIAYLSISFRFGFKNLEDLDMRGTSLQNSDVQCVVQGGRLRVLRLGPMGPSVRRLSNLLNDGLNLVMPDPRLPPPRQQVVVINMGPNGPDWRHANDADLDSMGLEWVKNGLNRKKEPEQQDHFFFGKEGKIVSSAPSEGECSNSSRKRKLPEEDDDDASEPPSKRAFSECEDQTELDEENSDYDSNPENTYSEDECEESGLPDSGLSDPMVFALKGHVAKLTSLSLVGCGLTDAGLLELTRLTSSLQEIDVSQTHVTASGLRRASALMPDCQFIGNRD